MTHGSWLAVIGRGPGVVRLEAVDGAKVGDLVRVAIHGITGDRSARVTAIGHGVMTCGTYGASPWDAPDVNFVELRALEPATTRPVIKATVRPSSHTTGGVALVVDAAGYLAIGSPLTGELVLRRADGVNLLARVGVVTSIFDTARHRSVIRVEIDLGLVDLDVLSTVEITDFLPPERPPTRIEMLLRGQLHG